MGIPMPSAITTSNSYVTIAEADALLDDRPYATAWTASANTDDAKTRSLITATRILDEQFSWRGVASSQAQPLGWPRTGVYDRIGASVTGVPDEIKLATALMALALTVSNRIDSAQQSGGEISSVSIGDISVDYTEGVVAQSFTVPQDVIMAVPGTWYSGIRERRRRLFPGY